MYRQLLVNLVALVQYLRHTDACARLLNCLNLCLCMQCIGVGMNFKVGVLPL